jgi:hypothetical protein
LHCEYSQTDGGHLRTVLKTLTALAAPKRLTIFGQNHVGTFFRSDLMVSHIMQFLQGVA